MEENDVETIRRKKVSPLISDVADEGYVINDKPSQTLLELYENIEKRFGEFGSFYPPRVVKETSLERIERKLDELRKEVATRDDVIAQTKQLLNHQEEMNVSLQEKIDILRSMQESNVPHKRLTKYSIVFLVFFIFSFISRIFFNVIIVTEFWNNLGLLVSFGFFIMSLAMGIDWKQEIKN